MITIFRALVGAVDAAGQSIFAGKHFTGYSNVEEDIGGRPGVTSYGYSSI